MTARILLADDHGSIRRHVSQLLEHHDGWEVAQAENGEQAVLKATELKPDIVILDIAMPVMNGIEAADEIAKALPSLPIVVYTLYDLPAVQRKARNVGVWQVIPKPDTARLVRTIEHLLAGAWTTAPAAFPINP